MRDAEDNEEVLKHRAGAINVAHLYPQLSEGCGRIVNAWLAWDKQQDFILKIRTKHNNKQKEIPYNRASRSLGAVSYDPIIPLLGKYQRK